MHLYRQISVLQLRRIAVCRHLVQFAQHIARKGFIFLVLVRLYPEKILRFFYRQKTFDLPAVFVHAFHRVVLFFVLVRHFADEQFEQVFYRDYAPHAAVFVHDDHDMLLAFLHLVEKVVRGQVFGHEKRRAHRLFHDLASALVGQSEVYLGVKHTHHVVRVLAADGVIDMLVFHDCPVPALVVLVSEKYYHVLSVSADVACAVFLELEHVLYHLVFLLVYLTGFSACLRHQDYLLFGDLFIILFRLNAEKLEHAVRRNGKQPYQRRKDDRYPCQRTRQREREFFRAFHRKPLGYKLPERNIEKRKYYRDEYHAHRLNNAARAFLYAEAHYRPRKRLCEKVRRERASQKSCKRNRNLYRGKEFRRALRQADYPPCPLVSLFSHFFQLLAVA